MSKLPAERVQVNTGGTIAERPLLNLVAGSGITLTLTDVPASGRIDVTIASSSASFATPAIVLGSAAAAGVAGTVIRSDATIAAFDTTAPVNQAMGDAAAVGSIAFAARRDHKHGMPSFATNAIVLGTAAAAGVATTPFRSDDTIAAFDTTAPTNSAVGDAAAVGSVAFAARRDHKHGREAFGAVTAVAEGDASASGSATTEARSDHNHGWPWQYSRVKPPVKFVQTSVLPNSPTYSGGIITAGSNGAITFDGLTPAVNDRVLIWLQSDHDPSSGVLAQHHGIYTVTTVGDATHAYVLTRATDFDSTAEVRGGSMVFYEGGEASWSNGVYAGTWFEQIIPNPTLDTDPLMFTPSDTVPMHSCFWATAAVLPNSPTYSAGVLTAGANAALVVDSSSPLLGDLILVKNQATGSQNGVYVVTAVGSGAAPWKLQRASFYNTSAAINTPWEFAIQGGNSNSGSVWVRSTTGILTLDTSSIAFAAISNTGGSLAPSSARVGYPTTSQVLGNAISPSRADHSHKTPGTLTALASTVAVVSTNVETTVISVTIPANTVAVGTTFRIQTVGRFQAQATSGTLTARVYYGTNNESSAMLSQTVAVGVSALIATYYVTVRSIGASGTFEVNGNWVAYPSASTIIGSGLVQTSTVVVDTTAAQTLKFTVQWATSSATNLFEATHGVIELLVP